MLEFKKLNCDTFRRESFNLSLKTLESFRGSKINLALTPEPKESKFEFIDVNGTSFIENTNLKDNSSIDMFDVFNKEQKKKQFRIMICDDDHFIIKSFVNLIKKSTCGNLDIVVSTVSNGLECLYKIYKDFSEKGEKLDLLFIDENMPFMNGGACIKNLNVLMENKDLNKIDIISTSSQVDEQTTKTMIGIGCKQCISKPIKLSDMNKILKEYY